MNLRVKTLSSVPLPLILFGIFRLLVPKKRTRTSNLLKMHIHFLFFFFYSL
jgi:hypothetical protein